MGYLETIRAIRGVQEARKREIPVPPAKKAKEAQKTPLPPSAEDSPGRVWRDHLAELVADGTLARHLGPSAVARGEGLLSRAEADPDPHAEAMRGLVVETMARVRPASAVPRSPGPGPRPLPGHPFDPELAAWVDRAAAPED